MSLHSGQWINLSHLNKDLHNIEEEGRRVASHPSPGGAILEISTLSRPSNSTTAPPPYPHYNPLQSTNPPSSHQSWEVHWCDQLVKLSMGEDEELEVVKKIDGKTEHRFLDAGL